MNVLFLNENLGKKSVKLHCFIDQITSKSDKLLLILDKKLTIESLLWEISIRNQISDKRRIKKPTRVPNNSFYFSI